MEQLRIVRNKKIVGSASLKIYVLHKVREVAIEFLTITVTDLIIKATILVDKAS